MPEEIEEKAKEKPKTVNDMFRDDRYEELKPVKLHDYFIASLQEHMLYLENIQKTFTP
jgi:hypothetical protein